VIGPPAAPPRIARQKRRQPHHSSCERSCRVITHCELQPTRTQDPGNTPNAVNRTGFAGLFAGVTPGWLPGLTGSWSCCRGSGRDHHSVELPADRDLLW
jgi:hypothetical protein